MFNEAGLYFGTLGFSERDSIHLGAEWWPGNWRLRVFVGIDLPYSLVIPATGNEPFRFSADEYRSGSSVAKAVLERTGTLMLDADSKKWKQIWEGGFVATDEVASTGQALKRATRGLRAKLLDWSDVYSKQAIHTEG
jgi:hypothetical protein